MTTPQRAAPRVDGPRASRAAAVARPPRSVPQSPRLAAPAVILLALLSLTAPALANGGIVRIAAAPVGPWFVTVYSSPTPLRTGEVDISVLVQDSADRVVDVPVTVDATPVGFVAEPVYSPATRAQATNKLFKAAKFDLGVPGTWEFRVGVGSPARTGAGPAGDRSPGESVGEPGGQAGVVSFEAAVTKSTILDRPFLLTLLLAVPLLILGWVVLGRDRKTEQAP